MDTQEASKSSTVWIISALLLIALVAVCFNGQAALFTGVALIPWCYVVGSFRSGRMTFLRPKRKDPVLVPLVAALLFLGVGANVLADLLHPGDILLPAAIVGILLWLAFYVAATRMAVADRPKLGEMLALGVLCLIYGGSTAALFNRLLDYHSPQTYPSQVTQKYVEDRRSTSYYLQVGDWGPGIHGDRIAVDYDQYNRTNIGDPLCMGIYSGLFGARWTGQVADQTECTMSSE
ncbi:hypothetical protein [Dyella mobilis]|uniref:Uncharacterized protein n=1 Tax=Dyella mobilis TaxID=1849582 RepID=A0ABS2KDX5_9GAMM|nr:hypothetical protein [Dyella mobilis]MBM7129055.1 hypothetical protein [Dyella mobilis]